MERKAVAMLDGSDTRGALVLEVAEELDVVKTPEAAHILNAAGDGGGDRAGREDRGDHSALDAEGLGEEGDGGIGGDGEEGGEKGVVHRCGSRRWELLQL